MGYWHSWRRPKEINLTLWRKIMGDFARIVPALEKRGVPLTEYGPPDTVASIREDAIRFHGKFQKRRRWDKIHPFLQKIFQPDWSEYDWAELRGPGGCDSFHFARVSDWDGDCCKTNRYNYELAVQSLLIIAKRHLGDDLAVWSDARRWWWHVPEDICQEVLGYGPGLLVPEAWETEDQLTDGESKIEGHRRMLAEVRLPARRLVDRIDWYDELLDDCISELMV